MAPPRELKEASLPTLVQRVFRFLGMTASVVLFASAFAGLLERSGSSHAFTVAERGEGLLQEYYVLGLGFLVLPIVAMALQDRAATPPGPRGRSAWRRRSNRAQARDTLRRQGVPMFPWASRGAVVAYAVSALVAWLLMAVLFWVSFGDLYGDQGVTWRPVGVAAVVTLAVGLVSAALMLPLGSRTLLLDDALALYDENGRPYGPAGAAPAVAVPSGRVPTQRGPAETPGPPAYQPPPESRSGSRTALRVVLLSVVVLVTLGLLGIYGYTQIFREATSPRDLADRFDEAGVTCTRYDVLGDFRDSKALWCPTDDGKAITVNTYTDPPTTDEYLTSKCGAFTDASPRGSLVVGDEWVIDVQQLVPRPPTTQQVADDLATVLGGTVSRYDCARVN